jgi:WhiB family redox-sensing transcriptional regulator
MEQCLRWALESGQDSGVWGGLSERERRRIHRRRDRTTATGHRAGAAADRILRDRLGEYEELKGKGWLPAQIAKHFGTNVQTLYSVDLVLEVAAAAIAAMPVVEQQEVAA